MCKCISFKGFDVVAQMTGLAAAHRFLLVHDVYIQCQPFYMPFTVSSLFSHMHTDTSVLPSFFYLSILQPSDLRKHRRKVQAAAHLINLFIL